MKAGKLIGTILDIGKGMIANGANTWQVEEALLSLLDTYCFLENDLLVMSNCIYATVHTCDNRTYTEVNRELLTCLNTLNIKTKEHWAVML